MVDQLLDREQKGSVESKEQLLDDYFSTFKVATYATKKVEEVEKEEEKEPEKEIISDEFSMDDPTYWEKLLRHHYEQHQEGEYAKMGKGKRIRKAVNYYTEGLESLSTKKEEDEFDDHDDNDFSDEEGGPRKKMRRAGSIPIKPNEAALPPLLARVGGQLEVLGFNSRQRRSFLNAVMRYGMPLSDAYHTNWRPRDLKNKTEKEFNAYVSLFMRHLCEPDNGNSHYFADGVPKEGLPRQQVLARIGVMGLIRRKVNEYAHINGELPSRPGSPDSLAACHTQMSTPAPGTPQPGPGTPQHGPSTPQPAPETNPSTEILSTEAPAQPTPAAAQPTSESPQTESTDTTEPPSESAASDTNKVTEESTLPSETSQPTTETSAAETTEKPEATTTGESETDEAQPSGESTTPPTEDTSQTETELEEEKPISEEKAAEEAPEEDKNTPEESEKMETEEEKKDESTGDEVKTEEERDTSEEKESEKELSLEPEAKEKETEETKVKKEDQVNHQYSI